MSRLLVSPQTHALVAARLGELSGAAIGDAVV